MTKGKGSPNWVRFDKAGKVVERRWYHDGGSIGLTTAEVPNVAGKCINEERGHAAHRRVARGVAIGQDRLI